MIGLFTLFLGKFKTNTILIVVGVVLVLPILWMAFKHFFSSSSIDNAQNQQDLSNSLYSLHVAQMQAIRNANSSLEYTRNDNDLMNIARNVANHLGTHIDSTRWNENEVAVVNELQPLKKGDFILLEYMYKKQYTESRELHSDLIAYLSTSQFNQIRHLIY